jgi:hypothetical protein
MKLLTVGEDLYLIKRQINPSYFNASKDPKKLIGMWVDHLGCDRVVEHQGYYLFVQKIEEAIEE